jgi:hypothetical protein
MAERSAMASGFSLSDIATAGGCCRKVATGGGAGRGRGSVRSTWASWAREAVGVMGDTGGRLGEADSDRFRDRSEEASLDEAGRGVVSTRSAGMAARWTVCRGAGPRSCANHRSVARQGAQRSEGAWVKLRERGWRSRRVVAAIRRRFADLALARPCQRPSWVRGCGVAQYRTWRPRSARARQYVGRWMGGRGTENHRISVAGLGKIYSSILPQTAALVLTGAVGSSPTTWIAEAYGCTR